MMTTRPYGELYQHTSLREHTSIRLLTLLPGAYGSRLRCRIHESEDTADESYEALSYVWGVLVFPRETQVCGEVFIPLTRNLYDGLRRLRQSDSARTLWIDALCIDQGNLEENRHQVAYMGRIFERASQDVCMAWRDLGVPRDQDSVPEA